KKPFKKAKIEKDDGLNISYDKKELEKYLPHVMSEISKKEKKIKIDSVQYKIEQKIKNEKEELSTPLPNELINPGAIDFIRRCTNKKEAIEILDFLLKRKEVSTDEYKKLKNIILQKGGLKKLIDESGGLKRPGYYERKYYKKEFEHQKFKGRKNF
ncbi:MAG: DUF2095 domain-containing protein, partial [Promethearchaeota archaeon]